MTLDQFWKIAIVLAFIAMTVFYCQGCVHDENKMICAEYGGVKKVTQNFKYCADGTVYKIDGEYYLDKSGEW